MKRPTARVLHVHRGNMRIDLPLEESLVCQLPVAALTASILQAAVKLQLDEPGRAADAIPLDDTPIALRVAGRDAALLPHLPLLMQTEGQWTEADLPIEGQTERTARLPVIALELVNAARSAVIL